MTARPTPPAPGPAPAQDAAAAPGTGGPGTVDGTHEAVRSRYAEAARTAASGRVAGTTGHGAPSGCCSPAGEGTAVFGATLYDARELADLPGPTVLASLGCGDPVAVADLHPGERVLDLGSGGGIDVLLAARRVGPTGFAYGVDMTDEMLEVARAAAERAGATNVAFLRGTIEDLPLPDASVDVVLSNCVVNLSPDKPAVLTEMFRVLAPGGRVAVSDVVAEDHLSAADRAARGSHVGCVAGALSRAEYRDGLAAAGFVDVSVEATHEVVDGMHASVVRATRPRGPAPA